MDTERNVTQGEHPSDAHHSDVCQALQTNDVGRVHNEPRQDTILVLNQTLLDVGSTHTKLVALLLAMAIAGLGLIGAVAHIQPDIVVKLFILDGEKNFPTLFAAGMLMVTAWLVIQAVKTGALGRPALLLALVFAQMGLDELFQMHETIELWAGIDWQILYLPWMLVAGALWVWVLLGQRKDRLATFLWLGAASAYVVSQLLEAAAWGWWGLGEDVQVRGYIYFMVSEEILEMLGISLFLLTLLRIHQLSQRPR